MNDPRTEGTFIPAYQCPECKQWFTDHDELRWYIFDDGERRKQCSNCDFHPDEVILYSKAIEENDFQN